MCFVRSERTPVATDRRGARATRRERARGDRCSFPRESEVSRRGGGDPNPPTPSSASSSATLERPWTRPAGRAAAGAAGREGSHPRRPVRAGANSGRSHGWRVDQDRPETLGSRSSPRRCGERRRRAGPRPAGGVRLPGPRPAMRCEGTPPTYPLFPSPKTLARANLRIKGDDPGVAPTPARSSQPTSRIRVTGLRWRSSPDGR